MLRHSSHSILNDNYSYYIISTIFKNRHPFFKAVLESRCNTGDDAQFFTTDSFLHLYKYMCRDIVIPFI